MAREPQSVVVLDRLDPPYDHWSKAHELHETVTPGAYRVQIRLGSDVYCHAELQLRAGDGVEVIPHLGDSPLLQDLLHEREPAAEAVVSESIGPIQAGVLPTVLPIIGIKPFDHTGELTDRLQGLVPRLDPEAFGERPLSLVLAVDGNDWPDGASRVLRSATAVTAASPVDRLPIAPLPEALAGGRIGLAVVRAPARSFLLRIESPYFGSIALGVASLDRRATVVTLTVRPDGSFDVSQNLLRIPGLQYQEPVAISYTRMLRDLQLGQKLFAGGELYEHRHSAAEMMMLFYAKWTDPILSCMAYFALIDALEDGRAQKHEAGVLDVVASNLERYFHDLPDARIVYALQNPERAVALLSELIALEELPVLSRSATALERYAQGKAPRLRELASRVVPGQPWLLTWSAGASAAAAERQLVATT